MRKLNPGEFEVSLSQRAFLLLAFVTIVAIVLLVGMCYERAERQSDRRATCISAGRSALDCRDAFPSVTGDK